MIGFAVATGMPEVAVGTGAEVVRDEVAAADEDGAADAMVVDVADAGTRYCDGSISGIAAAGPVSACSSGR